MALKDTCKLSNHNDYGLPIFKHENKVDKIRGDFPFFSQNQIIYLDSAATSQKPSVVIDAESDFYRRLNSNVHRGLYDAAEKVTFLYENARNVVANFINAKPSEIVFSGGTTDGINFIASVLSDFLISSGDEIVLSQAEHHSNLVPWQNVARRTGAFLRFIELDKDTFLLKNVCSQISSKTKLIAIIAESNVLGPVWNQESNDFAEVISCARQVGAKVLLDAAQLPLHKKIDVKTLDVDFLAFSAHKMLAPTGGGVLYINEKFHDVLMPYKFGGGMVSSVTFEKSFFAKAPQKFEAGTPPIAQAICLAVAIEYFLKAMSYNEIQEHESNCCHALIDGLLALKDVTIVGNKPLLKKCGHQISFFVKGIHSHDVAAYLAQKNICVRAGHFCVQPMINLLNYESLVRASFALYTTKSDIFSFLYHLEQCIHELRCL